MTDQKQNQDLDVLLNSLMLLVDDIQVFKDGGNSYFDWNNADLSQLEHMMDYISKK